jgi:hypothetical protein
VFLPVAVKRIEDEALSLRSPKNVGGVLPAFIVWRVDE